MFNLFKANDIKPVDPPCPGSPDWQLNLSMKNRLAALLECGFMSDVTFLVFKQSQTNTLTKEELKNQFQRFHAHKLILAISSPVFDTMFNSQLGKHKEVEVLDIEPAAFKVILK